MEYLDNFYEWSLQEGPFRMCEHLIVIYFIFRIIKRMKLNSRGKTGLKDNLIKTFIRLGNKIPTIKNKVEKELETEATKNVSEMLKLKNVKGKFSELPTKGIESEELMKMFDDRIAADIDPTAGKTFAYVYEQSKSHNKVTEQSFLKYMHSNALNPIVFNSLRVIENEVIRISSNLFHGDENCVGNITSCGTESLLLAMKTYRDYRGPGTIIMCTTGHPGINKGCHYVGMDIIQIPYDENKRMSISHLKSSITSSTVVVVCSAPQYPHGVVDNVE